MYKYLIRNYVFCNCLPACGRGSCRTGGRHSPPRPGCLSRAGFCQDSMLATALRPTASTQFSSVHTNIDIQYQFCRRVCSSRRAALRPRATVTAGGGAGSSRCSIENVCSSGPLVFLHAASAPAASSNMALFLLRLQLMRLATCISRRHHRSTRFCAHCIPTPGPARCLPDHRRLSTRTYRHHFNNLHATDIVFHFEVTDFFDEKFSDSDGTY